MNSIESTPSWPLESAIMQIQNARRYSTEMIDTFDDDEWFVIPDGGVTHLAWQVGHLAMAEYGLTLLRIRGKEPSDREFITNDFLRCFQKGTTPQPDPAAYPEPHEIRRVFDAVDQQAQSELPNYSVDQLSESLPQPTFGYGNKFGSLLFCAAHEMMHAGQIGTLRRMLGKTPIR